MPDPSSTAIVFVPGAWHNPDCFDLVINKLQAQGYTTGKAPLASVGAATPHPNFDEDVKNISTQIARFSDAGKNVVVVAHSYGGVPSTEAVKGLDLETRKKEGKPGGVVHFIYCCAFVLPKGESLVSALGNRDAPWYRFNADRTELTPSTPIETFYNDIPEADAKAAAATLKPQSYQVFKSPLTFAAWQVVPSTYLYCLKDQAIPIDVQRMMVNEFAKGVEFRTEEFDSSHSPFFSMPDEMAAAVHRAASL